MTNTSDSSGQLPVEGTLCQDGGGRGEPGATSKRHGDDVTEQELALEAFLSPHSPDGILGCSASCSNEQEKNLQEDYLWRTEGGLFCPPESRDREARRVLAQGLISARRTE